jgi:hypothetical protein
MGRKLTILVASVVSGTALTGGTVGASTRAAQPFKVTSTLEGQTVLPRRIHWYADAPSVKLRKIEFLIDGKVRWVELKRPYRFGDREDHASTIDGGFLVTSWLTPGVHRFTARATAGDGRVAANTVTARVVPTPSPPAALAGKWTRTVDPTGAPKPGTPGAPKDTPTPAGTYTLVFDKRWLQTRNPGTFTHASVDKNTGLGYVQDSDYQPGASTFHVWGAVSWRPYKDYLAEEGTWCLPWGGPQADYRWSVDGDTLTLASVRADPCRVRQFIWAGAWTRTN